MGPKPAAFLDQVAEAIPFNFPPGKGATEVDLSVAEAYHFPVSPPGAAFNENLLAGLQGVWLKNQVCGYGFLPRRNVQSDIICHESPLLSI